jgi:hypothetical protein
MKRYRFDGPACPADTAHGPLLPDRSPAADGYGWTCPHVAHDGRLRTDPAGAASQSRRRFTTAEVTA